ncbi:hypothetical protein RN22_18590 [Grimontia sp. AD028]|nr:hypothetical protein RN22_18590 [Grimontia sp. AD028]
MTGAEETFRIEAPKNRAWAGRAFQGNIQGRDKMRQFLRRMINQKSVYFLMFDYLQYEIRTYIRADLSMTKNKIRHEAGFSDSLVMCFR